MILRSGRMECTSDELAETFQQESNTFCVNSKCYEKALTLFSGQPIFHETLSVHAKHIFDNCAKNFWAEHGRNSFSNIEFYEKIWHCWKKVSKPCSTSKKRSHVNSAERRFSLVKIFPLQVPKDVKHYVFSTSWFLFKLIFCKI